MVLEGHCFFAVSNYELNFIFIQSKNTSAALQKYLKQAAASIHHFPFEILNLPFNMCIYLKGMNFETLWFSRDIQL